MLRSIQLLNFQSHKETKVEFSPGVNVIVGPSRHGKTALLRAIRWVIENRPAGDEFRSHWAKKGITCVGIALGSGETVERLKSNTSNKYVLNGEDFSGFGQDVPKPVAEALGMGDLNIQGQFDTPFLLFDSPGAAARYLNRVVHLDAIDTALANISSLRRQNDQDIRGCEARIVELQDLEAAFPDLEAAEEFISGLEAQQRELEGKAARKSALALLQDKIVAGRLLLGKSRVPLGVECKAAGLAERNSRKEQLEYTRQLLSRLQSELAGHRARGAALLPAIGKDEALTRLKNGSQALQKNRKGLQRLSNIHERIGSGRQALASKVAEVAELESEFRKMFPAVCPLCGRG